MITLKYHTAQERLQAFLSELPIEAKKSLGQNFLVADHIIEKILSSVIIKKPESVIEIGPGPGALTDILRREYKQFSVIEFDKELANYWKAKGLQVECADALRWDWKKIQKPNNTVLVSNLPYQISSSLVIERSLDSEPLQGMVLMFQKEVAQRIRAQPSTEFYGMLSVIAQTFWSIETVCDAGPRDFNPAPKVSSRVLSFLPEKKYSHINREHFLKFVKASFAQRRKLLKKNLESGWFNSKHKQPWQDWLTKKNYPETIRAEELSVADFIDLFLTLNSDQS